MRGHDLPKYGEAREHIGSTSLVLCVGLIDFTLPYGNKLLLFIRVYTAGYCSGILYFVLRIEWTMKVGGMWERSNDIFQLKLICVADWIIMNKCGFSCISLSL